MAKWRNWRQTLVTIRIIIEGGSPSTNNDVLTSNNTESLRQSLNSFFSRLLNIQDISIIIIPGFGYRNAAKLFVKDENCYALFVDSDLPPQNINNWFIKLKNENIDNQIIIPEKRQKDVYFMIQEMEAWFLKQTKCIEKWAEIENYTKRDSINISNHKLISNKNIEEISKPSSTLSLIIKHFYEKKLSSGKRKLATYGKLKTAPRLLDCIDTSELLLHDSELQRFKENIFKQSRTLIS